MTILSNGLDPLIVAIAAGTLLLIFVRGVWHKLTDHPMFRVILENYEIVPAGWVPAAAMAVTAAEAAVALGLLFPATRSLAALSGLTVLASTPSPSPSICGAAASPSNAAVADLAMACRGSWCGGTPA